jgi:hypothetical protein
MGYYTINAQPSHQYNSLLSRAVHSALLLS